MRTRSSQPWFVFAFSFFFGCGSAPTPNPSAPANVIPSEVPVTTSNADNDPYLWLENVDSDESLTWVRAQNATSQGELESDENFAALETQLRTILDSEDHIPFLTKRGAHYYNFWRDQSHPRGLWRRTTLAQYRRAHPAWETVLDLDALSIAENENWVWKWANCEQPNAERCLLGLSRGGADALVVREFDMQSKTFVEDGFILPEAKTDVSWIDRDSLFVATNFGEDTLTTSGYARQVRVWRRGTELSNATLVQEARTEDMMIGAERIRTSGVQHDLISVRPTFFSEEDYVRVGENYVHIEKPSDAEVRFWGNNLLLQLRSEWTVGAQTYAGGSLLMSNLQDYLGGARVFTTLFTPAPNKALREVVPMRTRLLLNVLEDVQTRLYAWSEVPNNHLWVQRPIHADIEGVQSIEAVDADESDDYWHTVQSYLQPARLSHGNASSRLQTLRSEPSFFDTAQMHMQQHFAMSRDGTRVPYFEVSSANTSATAPTLLYGYGGFEISLLPNYNPLVGAGWLAHGGTYVVANIRGGGEYGPAWHQAALRHNRQRAYDDFIAVAEDLIARGVTTRERLGIQGGSNGGLLMGVMLTQRPELFGAIVCNVPLLDMRRFHHLLAGASWVEEYGNPDDAEDWAALSQFSPYQNVHSETHYPPILFMSSTRDDRVHPAHGRKMVARMLESQQPVLYYENIEGGHGGAANNAQRAHVTAMAYTFLRRRLAE